MAIDIGPTWINPLTTYIWMEPRVVLHMIPNWAPPKAQLNPA